MDILKLVFDRAEALNGYWNLYIAVSFGVLGLMASGKPFTHLRQTKILLTIAFVLFAASNLDAILDTNAQRRALDTLIEQKFHEAARFAAPPADWIVQAFHAALDLLVVLCIWFVKWHSPDTDKQT